MLYSKNGSIPKPETDGTDGWIEVPDQPIPPEGMEVVWWFPPGWVIRPPCPDPVEGYQWNWDQTDGQWILAALPVEEPIVPTPTPTPEPVEPTEVDLSNGPI